MMSRKRIKIVKDRKSTLLRRKVQGCLSDPADVAALIKDLHLLELALAYDCKVLSNDSRSAKLAMMAAATYEPLRRVQWGDVNKLPVECLDWIKAHLVDSAFGRLG
jgi:hypothetical protein